MQTIKQLKSQNRWLKKQLEEQKAKNNEIKNNVKFITSLGIKKYADLIESGNL